jgi:hypothetical protein
MQNHMFNQKVVHTCDYNGIVGQCSQTTHSWQCVDS